MLTEVHTALIGAGLGLWIYVAGGRAGLGGTPPCHGGAFGGLDYSTVDGSALVGRILWWGVELTEVVGHVAEGWG
jgi:hypothetical protein